VRSHRLVPTIAVLSALLLVGAVGAARLDATKKREHTSVTATEVEWHITLSRKSAPAGSVTFVVHNKGKLSHQFIVIRTNLAAGKLPVKGTEVEVNKAGTMEGEIRDLKPGRSEDLTLTLKAGRYVLFCNMPGHYKQGQYAGFRVT
jgi:hypothetical protein